MPSLYPSIIRRLINELTKLPTIGERTAARLATHLISTPREDLLLLAEVLKETAEKIKLCPYCFFITDAQCCLICSDDRRVRRLLCVVEKPADVVALERSGSFRGMYHVLHGVWSPLKGRSTSAIRIAELIKRLQGAGEKGDPIAGQVEEVILATSTTIDGDATALYIANVVEKLGIQVTRIAQGLPKGGELEYADQMTLHLSLEGRRKL